MIYISNLAAGLESGLDRPEFLLNAIALCDEQVGLELFFHYHDAGYREKMKHVSSWLGLIPRTAHGPFLHVEATSANHSDEQRYLLNAYEWAFTEAENLQCHEMVFHTHQCIVKHEHKPFLQNCCKGNLRQLIRRGKEHGIQILIENLGVQKAGVNLFDEEEYINLVREFSETGCLIDIGHIHVAGWNLERTLSSLKDRIKGYHLHNNNGISDSHLPISCGSFDYTNFYRLYKKYTPDAHLTLEYGDGKNITSILLSADVHKIFVGISSNLDTYL